MTATPLLDSPSSSLLGLATPLLALTPLRMHGNWTRQPLIDFDESVHVALDADVTSLHEDAAFGVPWQFYLSHARSPPAFWTQHLERIQAGIASGGPWATRHGVLLSLSLVNNGLGRTCPAGNASSVTNPNAAFVGPLTGPCTACYDFNVSTNPEASLVRAAHLKYVADVVAATRPQFINHAVEVNMYLNECSSQRWAAVVDFANDVYAAVKAAHPPALVFPSFQAAFLRGQSDDHAPCHGKPARSCISANLAAIAPLHRDLFAMSAYTSLDGVTGLPNAPPRSNFSGYLEEILSELPPSEALAIAETGFLTSTLRVRDFPTPAPPSSPPICFPLLASTADAASKWLSYLFSLSDAGAYRGRWTLLTWWSDSDFLPDDVETSCYTKPCSQYPPMWGRDFVYCSVMDAYRGSHKPAWTGEALLKEFGTMGIRSHADLSLKPRLGTLWRSRCASCRSVPSDEEMAEK